MGIVFWRKTQDTEVAANPESVAVTETNALPVRPISHEDDAPLRVQIDQPEAGVQTIGGALDAGPNVAGTATYTTSADATGTVAIGPAPAAGQKSVLRQIAISTDTAMNVILQEETSTTAHLKFFLPANGTVIFVPRYPLKLALPDKRWYLDASAAGNLAIHTVVTSEG